MVLFRGLNSVGDEPVVRGVQVNWVRLATVRFCCAAVSTVRMLLLAGDGRAWVRVVNER